MCTCRLSVRVLILILLEYTLRVTIVTLTEESERLNPYSTGIYTKRLWTRLKRPQKRLNPYSTGIYTKSMSVQTKQQTTMKSLNPYSTGIYTKSIF